MFPRSLKSEAIITAFIVFVNRDKKEPKRLFFACINSQKLLMGVATVVWPNRTRWGHAGGDCRRGMNAMYHIRLGRQISC